MPSDPAPLGLGFAGLGWPGKQHAQAACTLPAQVHVAAACDLDPGRREAFAARFAPVRLHADYPALLADPAVNAVVIALPNFLHHSATLAALRAGKHVLCEKPPTLGVAEMEEIRTEVVRTGLTYAFSRQSRFAAGTLTARHLVSAGKLGDVYFARAERIRSRGIPAWGGGWFLDRSRAGGGVLIDIGIHALDDAWFILGCPAPLSVSAQASARFSHTLPPGTTSDVEDSAFAFLRFAGGVALHLEVAWAAHVTDAVPPSSWAGHELENTTLYGTQATLRLHPPTLYRVEGTGLHAQSLLSDSLTPDSSSEFAAQLGDFARAIVTGTSPVNNVGQALALMQMLAGVYRSSTEGHEISFG